jgi:hypothetical protein
MLQMQKRMDNLVVQCNQPSNPQPTSTSQPIRSPQSNPISPPTAPVSTQREWDRNKQIANPIPIAKPAIVKAKSVEQIQQPSTSNNLSAQDARNSDGFVMDLTNRRANERSRGVDASRESSRGGGESSRGGGESLRGGVRKRGSRANVKNGGPDYKPVVEIKRKEPESVKELLPGGGKQERWGDSPMDTPKKYTRAT